jgi:hypothetical protein
VTTVAGSCFANPRPSSPQLLGARAVYGPSSLPEIAQADEASNLRRISHQLTLAREKRVGIGRCVELATNRCPAASLSLRDYSLLRDHNLL